MAEPLWKQLLEDLRGNGYSSPYLDRLDRRAGGGNTPHASLQLEIIQETAQALGRAEDKVNVALLKLELLAKEITALDAQQPAPSVDTLNERIAAFNTQREAAVLARQYLAIHREAIGFRHDTEAFERLYPVPPAMARRGR